MYSPSYVHADYLGELIRPDTLRISIDRMCAAISRFEFDAVAFTGVSGMLLGPGVAMQMGKTMIIVRKEVGGDAPGSSCHSGLYVEGDYNAERYIVVDDLIASGLTFRTIQRRIRAAMPRAKCIGLRTLWDIKQGNLGALYKPGNEQELCIPDEKFYSKELAQFLEGQ